MSRVLMTAPFRFVGMISYSIYMAHYFILMIASDFLRMSERVTGISLTAIKTINGHQVISLGTNALGGDALHILALIPVILVSAPMYRFVEAPAREWSRRGTAKLPEQPLATGS